MKYNFELDWVPRQFYEISRELYKFRFLTQSEDSMESLIVLKLSVVRQQSFLISRVEQ